jgi:hypothetical protein
MRITSYSVRYQLDKPEHNCPSSFPAEPSVRLQYSGASWPQGQWKTDVESDLFNINRPTTKTIRNQYNPENDKMKKAGFTRPQECSFPKTHSRLIDPPCTLRSSGWNRWEWLCENPQEGVMMPFDNLITTRLQQKDQFRPCIPTPIDSSRVLPVPSSFDNGTPYEGLNTDVLSEIKSSVSRATTSYPQGQDNLPAAPSALYGIQPAPVTPSVALGQHNIADKL